MSQFLGRYHNQNHQPHSQSSGADRKVAFKASCDDFQDTSTTLLDTQSDTSSAITTFREESPVKYRGEPQFIQPKPSNSPVYEQWRAGRQSRSRKPKRTEAAAVAPSSSDHRHQTNSEEYEESIERLFLMLRPEAHMYIARLDEQLSGYDPVTEPQTQDSPPSRSEKEQTNTAPTVRVHRRIETVLYLCTALMFLFVGWIVITYPFPVVFAT